MDRLRSAALGLMPACGRLARRLGRGCPLVAAVCVLAAGPAPPIVTMEHRIFPGRHEADGNWAALLANQDGRVYVGLAQHGGDGGLMYYDSGTDRMVDVGNLTALAGESGLGRGPQSKIHTRFGAGPDGRIYFGTHGGYWWDFARYGTKEGYPGGHWMAFDPRGGQVEDFGIALPHDGLVTGAYDAKFNRLYAMTYPRGHFVYFDAARRVTVDKGRVNNWESVCRTLGIDDEGNVYGSFGLGRIFKYDPRCDCIRELSLQLPIRPKGITRGGDATKSETAWRVVVWDRETARFYGVEESATVLFSFDPRAGGEGQIRTLGQLCAGECGGSRDVAYPTLSLTLGLNRKLYYAPTTREFDYSDSSRLSASYLLSYDLKTGEIEALGEMRLRDGRRVIGTNAALTGPEGTLYFVGAIEVHETPGAAPEVAGKIGGVPYRLALLSYKPRP
jgi:hypothetical protein